MDITPDIIENKILLLRGQQVLLDRDLATLYGIETKRLNEAVKRNISRFPADFMFQLTPEECLRSQIVTLKEENGVFVEDNASDYQEDSSRSQFATLNKRGQNLKYRPYAFTENGVAMLSSVLKSPTAIEVNISIMRAFTAMRHFLSTNMEILSRMENIEYHQLELSKHQQESDKRIDEVFRRLDANQLPPQGIFFDGQVFDAYEFIADLVKSATRSIVLIDNYIDESTLTILSKRNTGVSATIYTANLSQQLRLDIERHNAQYAPIEVHTFSLSHDRFLCIDDSVYHVGASLKDLGKRWFAFSLLQDSHTNELINRIKQ